MNKIIQFPHSRDGIPGLHKKTDKPISTKQHYRHFIKSPGQYVDTSGKLISDDLCFWGEWEMHASVTALNNNQFGFPKYIITPDTLNSSGKVINSDPCVFGQEFKYYNCRQSEKSKTLKNLTQGDIIIFGSVIDINTSKEFYVDTVFVVAERIKYNTNNLSALKAHLSDYNKFYDLSLKGLECSKEDGSGNCCSSGAGCSSGDDLVLYKGATFDNPVDGMYSFSPCHSASSNPLGFERIKISQADFSELNPKHCRGIKVFKNEQSQHVWNVLHNRTISNKLFCGVQFDWP